MTVTQLSKKLDDILKDIPNKSFDKFCIMAALPVKIALSTPKMKFPRTLQKR
mgnify:CR=1 FL=1